MYKRILDVWTNYWWLQLNKVMSLLGARENEEAKQALKEALKMTNRVELQDDATLHLKQLQKKNNKPNGAIPGESPFVIIELTKFKTVREKTTVLCKSLAL
jgi:hypothetical protein